MEWICDQLPNAVMQSLNHVFVWRSTVWWKNTKALNRMVDRDTHTRWKHKWSWHNRGCVWHKIANGRERKTGEIRDKGVGALWTSGTRNDCFDERDTDVRL